MFQNRSSQTPKMQSSGYNPIYLLFTNTAKNKKVTSASICGSDLHLYHNEVKGLEGSAMKQGDILGHESMGIIEAVGPEVTQFQPGDRVVVSAIIACGNCSYCKNKQFSACDTTNPRYSLKILNGVLVYITLIYLSLQ
jgi:threonine dehydrogenase-like Zn-dependent dehydrogenase